MADDEPHHSSCSGGTASSSGGTSSSPSPSPPRAPPPLPLAAVVTPLPPPFPPASIATAIPLPQQQQHQQLLQQYQHQLHQQQRLFSFHLSSAAAAAPSPPAPIVLPLKHLPPLSSASPVITPGGAAASDRHSRDDCWSEGATVTLIHAWGDRYLELNRGNLKQKHWKDVADSVNRRADGSKPPKTDIQCKNRLDTLKKKYKLEKSKIVTGGGPSKWAFFDRLDELIGPSKKPKKPLPVKLRPSLPLLPPVIALPAKRPLEEADQHPQLQPPPPLPASNYCPPSASNAIPNYVGSAPTHVGSVPNHAISAPNHASSVPNCVGSTPNHASSAPNQVNNTPNHVGSTPNHVVSAVDAVSKSKESPHTADSCPNGETAQPKHLNRKRPRVDPMQDLAQAIIKFGEVYERTEITRQQTMAEIEKQRMIFTKDLELQRLQFFTQTQVELAKLRHNFKHGNPDHHM